MEIEEISTSKKHLKKNSNSQENIQKIQNIPKSKVNFDNLISKIQQILVKGENVEMKNKIQFIDIIKSTKKTLENNKNIFESLKTEPNMIKLFEELDYTIYDVESKLNKLALIKFCKTKAEKYLKNVSEKLENINMILLSYLAGRKNKNIETQIIKKDDGFDKQELLDQINLLNAKIESMEDEFRNKKEDKLKLKAPKPKISINEKLYEGLKHLHGTEGRINYKLAFEKFEEVVNEDDNNTEAKMLLAEMYEKGFYVEQSYLKAFQLYREASEKGNSKATYMIGYYAENKLYDDVKEFGEYDETAIQNYTKASEEGNSDAYAKLGLIYEKGYFDVEIDLKNAVENYQKSVDIDENPVGLNGLGNAYYNGNVYKRNYAVAVEYYTKAALNGNLDALNNLGICYEYGKGIQQSYAKAMECYKKASDKNHPPAFVNQAILLIKLNISNGKDQDYRRAYHLLQLYLNYDNMNPEVFYYIGFLYEIGFDVFDDGNKIQNPYMAFLHYKRAAELNLTKAKTKVGVAIYNGIEGVFAHDDKAGIDLLKEAAREGDQEAKDYLNTLRNLGSLI